MAPINYAVYSAFSVINFLGCIYALYRIYYYFDLVKYIPKFYLVFVLGWSALLLCFAVQQGGTVVYGDIGIMWTAKLAVTLFFLISLLFAKVSNYIIRKSTEP